MDKFADILSDRFPEADGGFRRRLTAGLIVGLAFLYAMHARGLFKFTQVEVKGTQKKSEMLPPQSSLENFLSGVANSFSSLSEASVFLLLISLLAFAAGRIVEILAEFSFAGVFGSLVQRNSVNLEQQKVNEGQGNPNEVDSVKLKVAKVVKGEANSEEGETNSDDVDRCRFFLEVPFTFGQKPTAYFAQMGGWFFLTGLRTIWCTFWLLCSPVIHLVRSTGLLDKYQKEISVFVEGQKISLSAATEMNISKPEDFQKILRNPFSREFETVWEYIKSNLSEYTDSDTKKSTPQSTFGTNRQALVITNSRELRRRERNFQELLTLLMAVVVSIGLIFWIGDPLRNEKINIWDWMSVKNDFPSYFIDENVSNSVPVGLFLIVGVGDYIIWFGKILIYFYLTFLAFIAMMTAAFNVKLDYIVFGLRLRMSKINTIGAGTDEEADDLIEKPTPAA